jgi:hypothetical protein
MVEGTELDLERFMKTAAALVVAIAMGAGIAAQETKPVPKDSVRVFVPGCTKGYMFTAGHRTTDEPGSLTIPEGMHLRMNGPKQMIAEIKAHEGSMIQITGLMKKGQYNDGISLGGGVSVSGAPASGGGMRPSPSAGGPMQIDLEGWRPVDGVCRSK